MSKPIETTYSPGRKRPRFCNPNQSPKERFWLFITKIGDHWIWNGACDGCGYGGFKVKKKHYSATRFSWEIHNGPIPQGLRVLHKCDIHSCCNPEHLFLGTQSDNLLDCSRKGRKNSAKGSNQGHSKLSEEEVISIRKLFNEGDKISEIARKFNMTWPAIERIVKRRTWKHI